MDTKWKKCKVLCSFMMFFIGVTMLIVNLIPAVSIFLALEGRVFQDGEDYQEGWEFRSLICGRLDDLLSVATGGKGWMANNAVLIEDSGYYDGSAGVHMEWNDRALNETAVETAVMEQAETSYDYMEDPLIRQQAYNDYLAEYGLDPSVDYSGYYIDDYYDHLEEYYDHLEEYYDSLDDYYNSSYDYYAGNRYSYGEEQTLDDYMAEMAHNKNIRYAVVYQNKLLYTNIEAYEQQTGQDWGGADFSSALSSEEYNFSLWYNRKGDGKVQIIKDGREEDVYGDGIYSDESRWHVPGYANFTLGEQAGDAVIFMAVAKEPQLYLVGNYSGYGVDQYGGRLYYMKQIRTAMYRQFWKICDYLTAAVILLAAGLLLRKNKRLGDNKITDVLLKVCLEIKIFVFLFLLLVLAGKSAGVLVAAYWKISNGFSSYCYWGGDITYEMTNMIRAGVYLAAFYWLFYLVLLDWKGNRTKQKKPILDLLKTKDFRYPIQKRLVRRQRIRLITEIVILSLVGVFFSVVCMFYGDTADYLLTAYDYGGWEGGVEWVYNGAGSYWFGRIAVMAAAVVFGVFVIFMLMDIWSLRKSHRLAEDIGALSDQIRAVREGNLTDGLNLAGDTDLQEAARNLNEIQKGMETALREQVKSERMKVDLVTNVSHDIKTPLTSIISYVELLRQEQDLPEHVKEFIQILGEKSERLRIMVQDVFEVSKATSGQLPINMETLDMGKLLRQTLADMSVQIEQSSFVMKVTIPENPMPVMADGQRLYRVFQNLIQNALHYSLEGSRIFLTLTEEAGQIIVRIKNTSSVELKSDTEFTERFVRGDESRTDGGSGLGLSIAKSFTQACGGNFTVETDADLFTVTVSFRKTESTIN